MQQTNSVYGSQELRIEAQDILDGTGKSVRCFTTGDTLRFQIQLAAHKAVRPLCGGSLHHDPKRKDRDTAVLHQ